MPRSGSAPVRTGAPRLEKVLSRMKRIKVQLYDPNTHELADYWLSTPTPYALELMAEAGVDFRGGGGLVDVDVIEATVPATDKELAAMTPAVRKAAQATRVELLAAKKRVATMTPAEREAAREGMAQARRSGIKQTHAGLAALLTMQEDTDSDGMPLRVWSRRQAADAIPWASYEHIGGVVRDLLEDATAEDDSEGEAVAEETSP